MRSYLHIIYSIALFSFITGCDMDKHVDRTAIASEMKARELKRLSESEIMNKGMEMANEFVLILEDQHFKNISKTLAGSKIDLELCFCPLTDEFIDTCRAVACRRPSIFLQINLNRDRRIRKMQVRGLALLVVVKGESNIGQPVKRQHAIGFWIVDRRIVFCQAG